MWGAVLCVLGEVWRSVGNATTCQSGVIEERYLRTADTQMHKTFFAVNLKN